jgi:hypothetical protein
MTVCTDDVVLCTDDVVQMMTVCTDDVVLYTRQKPCTYTWKLFFVVKANDQHILYTYTKNHNKAENLHECTNLAAVCSVVCMYTHTYTVLFVLLYVCTHIHTWFVLLYVCTHMHTCMYTHTYMYACTHIHTWCHFFREFAKDFCMDMCHANAFLISLKGFFCACAEPSEYSQQSCNNL